VVDEPSRVLLHGSIRGLAVVNSCNDAVLISSSRDETSASPRVCADAPATSLSQLNVDDLHKASSPSTILCGTVPGLALIDSCNDVVSSNSFEDESAASCRVIADAVSATADTSFSLDLRRGKRLGEYRDLTRSIPKMNTEKCPCKLRSEIYNF
jgi:hypothetical protein